MPIDFDSALGNLPQALQLRARRTETLASNLANAETPGYKARDFDFRAALDKAQAGQIKLASTHSRHIGDSTHSTNMPELQYRIPNQPSLDGNSVDSQLEKSAFSENAVQYQATLTFLTGKFSGLKNAIKGGE